MPLEHKCIAFLQLSYVAYQDAVRIVCACCVNGLPILPTSRECHPTWLVPPYACFPLVSSPCRQTHHRIIWSDHPRCLLFYYQTIALYLPLYNQCLLPHHAIALHICSYCPILSLLPQYEPLITGASYRARQIDDAHHYAPSWPTHMPGLSDPRADYASSSNTLSIAIETRCLSDVLLQE